MKVSEALEKALERLGPHGENWQKGIGDPEKFCSILAISPQPCYGKPEHQLQLRAIQFLKLAVRSDRLVHWNDLPERIWPEVKGAFQKAIALARQEESLDATTNT